MLCYQKDTAWDRLDNGGLTDQGRAGGLLQDER